MILYFSPTTTLSDIHISIHPCLRESTDNRYYLPQDLPLHLCPVCTKPTYIIVVGGRDSRPNKPDRRSPIYTDSMLGTEIYMCQKATYLHLGEKEKKKPRETFAWEKVYLSAAVAMIPFRGEGFVS
jgi:hypothetical protein